MSANKVLMVRPVDFSYNSETGKDNEFQRHMPLTPEQVKSRAMSEFDHAVEQLQDLGVEVIILEKGDHHQQTPDAVFPNNWFATDKLGNIEVFPMKTVNRRWEVRPDDAKALLQKHGFTVNNINRLEKEADNKARVLEGTGAIVFDHQHKIAYGALSERCHLPLLEKYCHQIGYQPHSFSSRSSGGNAIYHTNVLMSVGQDFVVACVDAILTHDRDDFIAKVAASNKTLIKITLEQMEQHYCGNILELSNASGQRILALSQRAWDGFTPQQQSFFSQRMQICANDITTIETIGGGSMRCMLAEVFNPGL
jgi:hypothetical protein